MINLPLLPKLIKVDIIVGGDHGGGKFCMLMKVNFQLVENENLLLFETNSKFIFL
jgi:hypothetical protein